MENNKFLTRKKVELHHYKDGIKIEGKHDNLKGDCTNLRGNCTNLRGDCSDLSGDCTYLKGDCSNLWGDLDLITSEMRTEDSNIEKYIK